MVQHQKEDTKEVIVRTNSSFHLFLDNFFPLQSI